MAERLLVPVYMPHWLARVVVRLKRRFIPPPPIPQTSSELDIRGERNVEWSFLSTQMPSGPGEAIEFGCEQGYMSLLAAQKGYRVLANDLEHQFFLWQHPNVRFLQGDFLELDLPPNHFDLAINCSSVEHVGVAGRYGIELNEYRGDIAVMHKLAAILKPTGILLMTAPCGRDTVMAPWCRVYGSQRLPKLFGPFDVIRQEFWLKDSKNRWVASEPETALNFQPVYNALDAHKCVYALGCFVLRRK